VEPRKAAPVESADREAVHSLNPPAFQSGEASGLLVRVGRGFSFSTSFPRLTEAAKTCRVSEYRRKELANRPLIRFGEALDADKLERLGRYEVHLDRKLERMPAMLLRLKDLRQWRVAG
jgi:hypothetical protein